MATRWGLLRAYLLFSALFSVLLFFVNSHAVLWYESLWISKGLLLLIGNILLVRSAARPLHYWAYGACIGIAVLANSALAIPPHWPGYGLDFWLSAFGFCSLALGAVMSVGIRDWNGMVLTGYLLLEALNLYSASEHIDRIGVSVSVACSVCYLGWIGGEITSRVSSSPRTPPAARLQKG